MIEIMPETQSNVLVVKASQKLTANDYETVFIPKLEQLLVKHGKIRVVMFLDADFHGWELGAAWDDTKFGIQHHNDFDKIALIGSEKWIEWAAKIGAYFVSGEVKFYPENEFDVAIDWVKA